MTKLNTIWFIFEFESTEIAAKYGVNFDFFFEIFSNVLLIASKFPPGDK